MSKRNNKTLPCRICRQRVRNNPSAQENHVARKHPAVFVAKVIDAFVRDPQLPLRLVHQYLDGMCRGIQ